MIQRRGILYMWGNGTDGATNSKGDDFKKGLRFPRGRRGGVGGGGAGEGGGGTTRILRGSYFMTGEQ